MEAAVESEDYDLDEAAHRGTTIPLTCAICGEVGPEGTDTHVSVVPISAKEYAEWIDAPRSLHVRCDPECFGLRNRLK